MALRLLDLETPEQPSSDQLAAGAERALQRLRGPLIAHFGAEGFYGLLRRALQLARREYAFLEPVEAGARDEACLKGLPESVRERAPADVRAGLAGVLANLLWLLVTFIGQNLALRLVSQVWPEAMIGEAAPRSEEAE